MTKLNYYQIHGILQMVAFLLLFPVGAAIALFRDKIGSSWIKYHVSFQLSGTFVVFLAIISIIYAESQKKEQTLTKEEPKKQKYRKIHKIVGPFIVAVILFQILWAYQGRKIVEWNTWYIIHMLSAGIIVFGGIFNVILGLTIAV